MQHCRSTLAEWLEAFPEGCPWVSLLLLGMLTEAEKQAEERPEYFANCRKLVGPLLWARLNEPVDEDWLRGSSDCKLWFKREHMDILEEAREWLSKAAPSEWGVTAEQHSDLQAWCGRMLERRGQLQAAEKKRDATVPLPRRES